MEVDIKLLAHVPKYGYLVNGISAGLRLREQNSK